MLTAQILKNKMQKIYMKWSKMLSVDICRHKKPRTKMLPLEECHWRYVRTYFAGA